MSCWLGNLGSQESFAAALPTSKASSQLTFRDSTTPVEMSMRLLWSDGNGE